MLLLLKLALKILIFQTLVSYLPGPKPEAANQKPTDVFCSAHKVVPQKYLKQMNKK